MYNKIKKTVEKDLVEVNKKRMVSVIEKVVDVFNDEMVTVAEMKEIIKVLTDVYNSKV